MSTREAIPTIQKTARTAGFLYFLLIPLGVFGMLYVPETLTVEGDTAATVRNIADNTMLFRAGIVSALVTQVVQIAVVLALYRVLEAAGREAAWLMVVFILCGVPIAMLNELNQVAILHVVGDGGDTALIGLFLALRQTGIFIAQIFWGLWLFPMGYLVYKSGYLPRVIGVFLVVAGFGYLADAFAHFLALDLGVVVSEFTFLGEAMITFWLLIRGVNVAAFRQATAR
jgi:hypothetical protein